jgi:hypothetical protein
MDGLRQLQGNINPFRELAKQSQQQIIARALTGTAEVIELPSKTPKGPETKTFSLWTRGDSNS